MTQELVLVVLLTGLIGLIWIMTLGSIDEDHPNQQSQEPESASNHNEDAQRPESALNHQTIAA